MSEFNLSIPETHRDLPQTKGPFRLCEEKRISMCNPV
jgi:hypothetical protein